MRRKNEKGQSKFALSSTVKGSVVVNSMADACRCVTNRARTTLPGAQMQMDREQIALPPVQIALNAVAMQLPPVRKQLRQERIALRRLGCSCIPCRPSCRRAADVASAADRVASRREATGARGTRVACRADPVAVARPELHPLPIQFRRLAGLGNDLLGLRDGLLRLLLLNAGGGGPRISQPR